MNKQPIRGYPTLTEQQVVLPRESGLTGELEFEINRRNVENAPPANRIEKLNALMMAHKHFTLEDCPKLVEKYVTKHIPKSDT